MTWSPLVKVTVTCKIMTGNEKTSSASFDAAHVDLAMFPGLARRNRMPSAPAALDRALVCHLGIRRVVLFLVVLWCGCRDPGPRSARARSNVGRPSRGKKATPDSPNPCPSCLFS